MKILITGGSGFIGSALVRHIIENTKDEVVNIDKLTYAGNEDNLIDICQSDRYTFKRVDICDDVRIKKIFKVHTPDVVMHLAAESHVDRSIDSPSSFIETNLVGTYTMLEASRNYWEQLSEVKRNDFRFHHISTDEVFGDLGPSDMPFTEKTPYAPSSPYSATKAGADHLVRAWGRTYNLPIVISNCSNNYGANQFPEKLLPLFINNIKNKKSLPVYGDGKYTRDWLWVNDHAAAIEVIFHKGKHMETYNIGGFNEWTNLDLIKLLCEQMDLKLGREEGTSEKLITYVKDRPGHDKRYAIDATKLEKELGWKPSVTFEEGLAITIDWYLQNEKWMNHVTSGNYQNYYKKQYVE